MQMPFIHTQKKSVKANISLLSSLIIIIIIAKPKTHASIKKSVQHIYKKKAKATNIPIPPQKTKSSRIPFSIKWLIVMRQRYAKFRMRNAIIYPSHFDIRPDLPTD